MCPQIIVSGSLNIPALQTDDAYVQIVAPPGFIRGVPTDVIGLVGTASYGPVNTAVHLGSGQDAVLNFGPMSAASITDPYDLATDLFLAFGQNSAQGTMEAQAVRVTDGTDTKSTITMSGTASPTAKVLTIAGGSLVAGDIITAVVTSAQVVGSPISVTYTVTGTDTLTTIAAGVAAAINANGSLIAAGVSALSAVAVVSVYAPSAVTMTVTGSSSGSETVTPSTGGTTTVGCTVQSLYSGILSNSIKAVISTGSVPSTFTVTITPPVGLAEVYPNIPGASFWATLATAVNFGQSTIRSQSGIVKIIGVTPAVGPPSTGTLSLAGGTDGRAGVNTATMLGSSSAIPATGLFALSNVKPQVGIAWLCGVTDLTSATTILSFNQLAGASSIVPLKTGLTTAAAIAATQAAGVGDPSVLYAKDFIIFFDTINNVARRATPSAVIGGRWATLGPEQSPSNKTVNLVIGTERNDPVLGSVPYSSSEIGQLETAGITLITNPIPRGSVFGIRHGQSSSLSPVTSPAEYWRMTMYLARSAAGFIGNYIGEPQSQQAQDPVRQSLALQSNQFLKFLRDNNQIDAYLVTCAFSTNPSAQAGNGMNTPSSVAAHYLFCLWQVTYLSSVRFLIMSLQGGTTVVEVAASLQPQQVTL